MAANNNTKRSFFIRKNVKTEVREEGPRGDGDRPTDRLTGAAESHTRGRYDERSRCEVRLRNMSHFAWEKQSVLTWKLLMQMQLMQTKIHQPRVGCPTLVKTTPTNYSRYWI